MYRRLPEQRHVADGKQDAQLRGAHLKIGNFEVSQSISGEINLYREHEIGDEQAESDSRRHVSREAKAAEEKEGAERVYNVVNRKAVARAGVVAKACQSAIQRITQPVKGETENYQNQSGRVGGRPPVCCASSSHGKQTQKGEMVRVDPGGCAGGQPDQGAFLQAGKKALLYPPGFTKAGLGRVEIAKDGAG